MYHLQQQLIRLWANHHFLILSKVSYSLFFFHSHMCIPAIPSHQLDEPSEPASPPPHPAGLRRTASFYTPLDGHQLGRCHSILAIPSLDPDDFRNLGDDTIEEPVIDETSPSVTPVTTNRIQDRRFRPRAWSHSPHACYRSPRSLARHHYAPPHHTASVRVPTTQPRTPQDLA